MLTRSRHPLSFDPNASEIKQRLTARGRKFESLRGYHFRNCTGTKILLETESPEERAVSGRVIIDAFAYYTSNNIVKPALGRLGSNTEQVISDDDDSDSASVVSGGSGSDTSDSVCELKAVKPSSPGLKRVEDLQSLTDEQCLLTTPWLYGIDLKSKDWARFNVDELSDIVWNDDAFEHLVLPGNEKHLAWAFVENKCLSNNQFDDFVQDKGRGIIIL